MSIHINADKSAIADKVLLPGDPLRAQHIAQTFLENPVQYNSVRGMYGFTGTYKGKRVSVQGTGMGMPSFSIYATELIEAYGAKRLIRVGTCGTMQPHVHMKDVVLATSAHTDSNMNCDRFGSISFAPAPTFELLKAAWDIAQERNISVHAGSVYTSDKFYDDRADEKNALMQAYGALAVDMETCELYTLAAKHKIESLTLMTVSDSILTGEGTSSEERQTAFNAMVEIALEII